MMAKQFPLLILAVAPFMHASAHDSARSRGPVPAPVIHVGDGTLDGRMLRAYDNVWAVNVRYRDGRREERGLSSDHVRFREINGRRYLTRVEGSTSVVGNAGAAATAEFSMTFNVFDPYTMAPLFGSAASSGNEEERHEFAERHVTVTSRTGSSAETRATIELTEPVYDFHNGMTGLLLAALPLRVGYKAVLPGLGERGADATEIRVVGQESVSAGHLGVKNTFVVEIGPAPARSVYWISKKAPYVIKAEVRAPDAVASWDML
jgi:hypothetical protein